MLGINWYLYVHVRGVHKTKSFAKYFDYSSKRGPMGVMNHPKKNEVPIRMGNPGSGHAYFWAPFYNGKP